MASKKDYAQYCVALIEGDTYFLEELYNDLKNDGFVDNDGEWIYEDEENDT